MPLIRYRTGDIGSLITGQCGCGSALPRLGKIRGRRENLKNKLHIHLLDDILFALPDIKAYRAVLAQDMLHLTIEGKADEQELSAKLDIETRVVTGAVLPYRGKRSIMGR
jgi:phenylacetate-coenzyme A ligase PaaK-like adenylate-forming protein